MKIKKLKKSANSIKQIHTTSQWIYSHQINNSTERQLNTWTTSTTTTANILNSLSLTMNKFNQFIPSRHFPILFLQRCISKATKPFRKGHRLLNAFRFSWIFNLTDSQSVWLCMHLPKYLFHRIYRSMINII